MHQPHVHLVDDDAQVLDAHRFVLSVAGFRVSTFESAEAFLKAVDARDVGCAVMDLRMPGMSGLECLDVMRREGLDMPVLFVTGHGDMTSAVAALKNGAADFIAKPSRRKGSLKPARGSVRFMRPNAGAGRRRLRFARGSGA